MVGNQEGKKQYVEMYIYKIIEKYFILYIGNCKINDGKKVVIRFKYFFKLLYICGCQYWIDRELV